MGPSYTWNLLPGRNQFLVAFSGTRKLTSARVGSPLDNEKSNTRLQALSGHRSLSTSKRAGAAILLDQGPPRPPSPLGTHSSLAQILDPNMAIDELSDRWNSG